MMKKISEHFKKYWLKYLLLLGIGIVAAVIYLAIKNQWQYLYSYISAFEFAGALIILIGLLIIVTDFGAFEIFSYIFKRKKFDNGAHENYAQYSERRKEQVERKDKYGWICYILVGAFLFLIVLILFLINKSIK